MKSYLKEFHPEFYDMVTVGERGQVVVPSKARKDMGIMPGDKLIAIKGAFGKALVLVNMKEAKSTFNKISKMFNKFAAEYSKEG